MDKQTILDHLDKQSFYSREIPTIKWNGTGWGQGLCPFHDDHRPSFFANSATGQWNCKGCNKHGSIFDFYMERHVVNFARAKEALAQEAGVTAEPKKRVVKTYSYQDAGGKLLFETVRYDPKDFKQRRPDGRGGWIYNLHGVQMVPYRLPEVLKVKSVIIVEGEKDADSLKALGLVATTSPMGAGKWRQEYSKHFKEKRVAIIPDNDEPGRKHAQAVAGNLKGVAESVKVMEFPGLPHKGDASDWIAQGGKREKLIELIKQAPEWTPSVTDTPKRETETMIPVRIGDLLAEPEEATDWTVEGMLPAGGFSVCVAKPKAGKSTLVRNLAVCVARGEAFFDRRTKQGPVIYFSLEEKRAEVKKNFRSMGVSAVDDIYVYIGKSVKNAFHQIEEAIKTIKPILVIIDPLFKVARVKDINAGYTEAQDELDKLLWLARTSLSKAHLISTHHAGKGERSGGDACLGTTAIFGSVDSLIHIKRHEGYRTVQTQQRYGTDLEETTLVFDKETGLVTIGSSRRETDQKVCEDAILEFLVLQTEPVTEPLIMDETEGRQAIKRAALRRLVKVGKVQRTGKGSKGDPFKYSRTLVPAIYGVQEYENPKNDENPCQYSSDSCTQDFEESTKNDESRVREFYPENGQKDGAIEVVEVSGEV